MVKRLIVIFQFALACATLVSAQSTEPTTQSTRTRVVAPKPSPTPRIVIKSADPEAGSASQKRTQVAPSPLALWSRLSTTCLMHQTCRC